jgi:hypothetical protein
MKPRTNLGEMLPDVRFRHLKNPVRGCLFIETTASLDLFLFVFRRRGVGVIDPFDNSGPNRWSCGHSQLAPPKNKKKIISEDTLSYKQATPNGVWSWKAKSQPLSPEFLDWSLPEEV